VKIVNTGGDTTLERNAQSVLGRIMKMAMSGKCNAAFARARRPTPNDLVQKGIILASRRALTDSSYNSALGISESIRIAANKSNAPLQTIRPQFTTSGKPVIIFAADAFEGNFLEEGMPHEFVHGGGFDKQYGLLYSLGLGGHDLDAYPHYQDIIKNCR
jgi:hypothetical protein